LQLDGLCLAQAPLVQMPAPRLVLMLLCRQAWALQTSGLPRLSQMTRASLFTIDAQLESAYVRAERVPCPFFRRRFTDSVESAQLVMRWIHARHKSLPIEQPALLAAACAGKREHLPFAELADILCGDFGARRGYVSGRLADAVYADDCFFDGPDPDMPVRGLRKYCAAVSGLFDAPRSECRLLGAPVVDELARTIVCHWRLSGRLRLPWKPAFKPYLGYTTYHIDARTGLVSSAVEAWSLHPFVAFLSVLLPRVADVAARDAPDVQTLDEWLAAWIAAGAAPPTHSVGGR
jgi:hypothetical protein